MSATQCPGLYVPEEATAATCAECLMRFADEVSFEVDADLHSLQTGHKWFEFETTEGEAI